AASDKIAIEFVAGWADHPLLADAFAEKLCPMIVGTSAHAERVSVIFTAHSVPCRTVQTQQGQEPDPYSVEAKMTAALVAEHLNIPSDQWFFAFQSQGISGGPWIGPTVEDTLAALHQQGHTDVILQPIGFLCDHVEILYDIDISFRETANKLGLRLERPESLNASPLLTLALADLAHRGLDRLHAATSATEPEPQTLSACGETRLLKGHDFSRASNPQ
ncbi:MAG TPA: ferrochelatase, partial [Acidisarcina sp.]